ncbi:MbtH family NRPS accessory protein [Streptomyces sp. MB09-01]|uniref:MbtH family protein n=1 Tax=Streptomyces sp. MB09-01 TaxID=3028666 RepID=UPI0029A3A9B5|nr:MbtH family NRPS accessory protein [Streptomyces sp. MB09-01]MDX3535547.1 MbtH family NRPS accessory protein [Streptomyces sp. MB09-01]
MRSDGSSRFHVVVNAEEQYSIWPSGHALPEGWRLEGTSGSEDECLRRIESVWPDIRPLTVRTLPAARAATAPASTSCQG